MIATISRQHQEDLETARDAKRNRDASGIEDPRADKLLACLEAGITLDSLPRDLDIMAIDLAADWPTQRAAWLAEHDPDRVVREARLRAAIERESKAPLGEGGARRSAAVPADSLTPKQLDYIKSLAASRNTDLLGRYARMLPAALAGRISKREASELIDKLREAPARATPPPTRSGRPVPPPAELEAGIYLLDDTVYKVIRAVHGSGKMYAKRLVLKGKGQRGAFEYAPGVISQLTAEHQMTLADAERYGALYGICCNCAATLTDEKSIARAMGPVCAKKFA